MTNSPIDGECVQTIVHPAISVWSVTSMPNGDIVTGASDSVVRVFSAAEERWAPADDLKQFDETVARQALPSYATSAVCVVSRAKVHRLHLILLTGSKLGM